MCSKSTQMTSQIFKWNIRYQIALYFVWAKRGSKNMMTYGLFRACIRILGQWFLTRRYLIKGIEVPDDLSSSVRNKTIVPDF